MALRLGKLDYKFDPKTLKLGKVISTTVAVPPSFDNDAAKAPFPVRMWGNDEYGDCVKAGQANQTLRLERVETNRTPNITDDDVVRDYKEQTGCASPGDANDTGLVILENNKLWRKVGLKSHHLRRNFTIGAFGELNAKKPDQLKAAIYLLQGVQFGFALPAGIQNNATNGAPWDVPANAEGPEWEPGSWGGHCVYGVAYNADGIIVWTWGVRKLVTWKFIDTYADEAWGVVDQIDKWDKRPEIDVKALLGHLRDIGASNIQS